MTVEKIFNFLRDGIPAFCKKDYRAKILNDEYGSIKGMCDYMSVLVKEEMRTEVVENLSKSSTYRQSFPFSLREDESRISFVFSEELPEIMHMDLVCLSEERVARFEDFYTSNHIIGILIIDQENYGYGQRQVPNDDAQAQVIVQFKLEIMYKSDNYRQFKEGYLLPIAGFCPGFRFLRSLMFERNLIPSSIRNIVLNGVDHYKSPFVAPRNHINYELSKSAIYDNANEEQLANYSNTISLVKGPPGTGKSQTIVGIIEGLVNLFPGETILVTAKTNVAVVCLLNKIIRELNIDPFKIVLVGRYDTLIELMNADTRPYLLEERINEYFRTITIATDLITNLLQRDSIVHYENLNDVYAAMEDNLMQILRYENVITKHKTLFDGIKKSITKFENGEISLYDLWNISHVLTRISKKKDYIDISKDYIKYASIYVCTLSSSLSSRLINEKCGRVIVDEASQCLEWEILSLLRNGIKSITLVGDEKQLPGLCKSQDIRDSGRATSFFERLLRSGFESVVMLKEQFRMHKDIVKFASKAFYDNELKNSKKVLNYKCEWYDSKYFKPLMFINHFNSMENSSLSGSKGNLIEANHILAFLSYFVSCYPKEKDTISIICPYSYQVEIFKEKMGDFKEAMRMIGVEKEIDVGTVDAYQGHERDIIILSLTRSNPQQEIGFVEDAQRMNVAITRARRALWVFGDANTFSSSNLWTDMMRMVMSTSSFFAMNTIYESFPANLRELWNKKMNGLMIQEIEKSENRFEIMKLINNKVVNVKGIWSLRSVDNALKKISKEQVLIKRNAINFIIGLTRGNFGGINNRPYINSVEMIKEKYKAGNIFYAKDIGDNKKIVWTIGVDLNKRIQVLEVLDLISGTEIYKGFEIFKKNINKFSIKYLNLCFCELVLDENRIIYPNRFDLAETTGIKRFDCVDQAQANLTNSKESNLSCKIYSLNSEALEFLLENNFEDYKELPYLLEDTENKIVKYKKNLIIVGRSGTGKTSVISRRLLCVSFNNFKSHLNGKQLFLTASEILCRNVKEEYEMQISKINKIKKMNIESDAKFLSFKRLLIYLDSFCEDRMLMNELEYEKYKMRMSVGKGNASSVNKLKRNNLKSFENNFVGFEKFHRKYFKGKTKSEALNIFNEIMFYIKGSFNNLIENKRCLEMSKYIKQGETRRSKLNKVDYEQIYQLYLKYEKNKNENGDFDISDICFHLFNQLHQNDNLAVFDYIYIDEIQDLLPIQMALIKLLMRRDNQTLFTLAGDQVQCITEGNIFKFEIIKDLFYYFIADNKNDYNNSSILPHLFQLKKNFRSQANILKVGNFVTRLIHFFFPSEIDKLEDEVGAINSTMKPTILNHRNIENFLIYLYGDSNSLGADQVILVKDEFKKKELERILEENNKKAQVLTITESKGLEFSDVVIFDFFKSSLLENKWRYLTILDKIVQEDLNENFAEKMNTYFKGKNSNFEHSNNSTFFNDLKFLYVGITRAKNLLVFFDTSENSLYFFNLLINFKLAEYENKNYTLAVKSSDSEWNKKGNEFFNKEMYVQALNCFKNTDNVYKISYCQAKIYELESKSLSKNQKQSLLKKAAIEFEKIDEFKLAAECFFNADDFVKAGNLFLKIQDYDNSLLCFRNAKCYEKAFEIIVNHQNEFKVIDKELKLQFLKEIANYLIEKEKRDKERLQRESVEREKLQGKGDVKEKVEGSAKITTGLSAGRVIDEIKEKDFIYSLLDENQDYINNYIDHLEQKGNKRLCVDLLVDKADNIERAAMIVSKSSELKKDYPDLMFKTLISSYSIYQFKFDLNNENLIIDEILKNKDYKVFGRLFTERNVLELLKMLDLEISKIDPLYFKLIIFTRIYYLIKESKFKDFINVCESFKLFNFEYFDFINKMLTDQFNEHKNILFYRNFGFLNVNKNGDYVKLYGWHSNLNKSFKNLEKSSFLTSINKISNNFKSKFVGEIISYFALINFNVELINGELIAKVVNDIVVKDDNKQVNVAKVDKDDNKQVNVAKVEEVTVVNVANDVKECSDTVVEGVDSKDCSDTVVECSDTVLVNDANDSNVTSEGSDIVEFNSVNEDKESKEITVKDTLNNNNECAPVDISNSKSNEQSDVNTLKDSCSDTVTVNASNDSLKTSNEIQDKSNLTKELDNFFKEKCFVDQMEILLKLKNCILTFSDISDIENNFHFNLISTFSNLMIKYSTLVLNQSSNQKQFKFILSEFLSSCSIVLRMKSFPLKFSFYLIHQLLVYNSFQSGYFIFKIIHENLESSFKKISDILKSTIRPELLFYRVLGCTNQYSRIIQDIYYNYFEDFDPLSVIYLLERLILCQLTLHKGGLVDLIVTKSLLFNHIYPLYNVLFFEHLNGISENDHGLNRELGTLCKFLSLMHNDELGSWFNQYNYSLDDEDFFISRLNQLKVIFALNTLPLNNHLLPKDDFDLETDLDLLEYKSDLYILESTNENSIIPTISISHLLSEINSDNVNEGGNKIDVVESLLLSNRIVNSLKKWLEKARITIYQNSYENTLQIIDDIPIDDPKFIKFKKTFSNTHKEFRDLVKSKLPIHSKLILLNILHSIFTDYKEMNFKELEDVKDYKEIDVDELDEESHLTVIIQSFIHSLKEYENTLASFKKQKRSKLDSN
ncbi:AAA domain-containing protein [Rozella allomycis CSF55]|uniref:AAA domain-containing protein n=2 Tax=Rozella allomycis (strain CSF55) TaxID=988480 RepID=A0A075B2P3_ROZAC|nr:AAA domain-containing protein [Rozella allomycis CSF55]|eukprot:EPZ35073.1 AAA domain-containing protein [Rozella allomycis CSF55]